MSSNFCLVFIIHLCNWTKNWFKVAKAIGLPIRSPRGTFVPYLKVFYSSRRIFHSSLNKRIRLKPSLMRVNLRASPLGAKIKFMSSYLLQFPDNDTRFTEKPSKYVTFLLKINY